MSKQKPRFARTATAVATPFEQARDEMFQHIMTCGVIGATPEDRNEWFQGTMTYLAERYHELSQRQIAELRVLGERFSQPAKIQAAV